MDVSVANTSAARRIDLPLNSNLAPAAIAQRIDDYLVGYQAANLTLADDAEDVAFELGCLWGTQLVNALAWHWIKVAFDSGSFAIGVAPTDHSLVIYPFLTIFTSLERAESARIDKSFRILTEPGRVPMLAPGGLENVMEHVH